MEQSLQAIVILDEAENAGEEKKVVNIVRSYEKAADMVLAAPPTEKLKLMKEAFNAAVAPDPKGCPTIDKSFCETYSKTLKVFEEVKTLILNFGEAKTVELQRVASKQKFVMDTTINDAYATRDEKKIARILDAYRKAADAVIAAGPAKMVEVMDKAFTAASVHPNA